MKPSRKIYSASFIFIEKTVLLWYILYIIIKGDTKMNLKVDLSEKNQQLLQEIGISIENRDYTKEEIKLFINSIGSYIFSRSSKNGDMAKATTRYGDLLNILVRNEK